MAYALDGENDLDDLLSCPVCQEHFTDPRMLQCGHSFCEKCIIQCLVKDGLPNGYKQICCPVCRMKQMLGLKQDAQTLPRNYAVAHITDHMREKNNMAATDKVYYCSLCTGSGYIACFFCFECGKLCSTCLKKHDSCYQDHITVDVPDCNFSIFECDKHMQQKLKLYCSDCGTAICTHCHIVDHSGHATESISNKLQSWHNDAQRSLNCLKEKQEKNTSDLSHLSSEIQTLHATREQIIGQIRTRKQELVDQLDKQELELITQLDKSFDDESKVINSVHEMANSKAYELQRFMVSANDMSDSASLLHFLKSGLDIDGELLRIRDFAENKDTTCTIPTSAHWQPLMSNHPNADLGRLMFDDELQACAQKRPTSASNVWPPLMSNDPNADQLIFDNEIELPVCTRKSPPSTFPDDDIVSCSADLGYIFFDEVYTFADMELIACDRKSPLSDFSDNDIVSSKKNIEKECLNYVYSREKLLQINQLHESKLEPTVLDECDCILPHTAAMKLQRTEVQLMDIHQPLATPPIVTHSEILEKREKNKVLFGYHSHKDISVWRKE